jgi:hypothetical protein
MLGVDGLGCFAGGDTSKQGESREIKGNQGKSRGIKGNQGKSRGIKGNQEESRGIKRSQGDQCEPRKNEMK